MPRVKMGFEHAPRHPDSALVERLSEELRGDRESGQPFIYEQAFSTGKVVVLVVWDKWKDSPLEKRSSTILSAIEWSDGKDYRIRVALANGLTVPEATAAGMLPFRIITALRKGDAGSPEECREAMIEEGASTLFGVETPQLRFPTEDTAEACMNRLIKRLPNSEEV